ncbi:hypothetical protein [Staphylococcus hominis]|uniref:hypothetical protein n=1 Tax=Staphylococcus hominis TaxID=1290 RepID=UPI0012DC8146|nr:hypothetical protein [Staphylococcus hominis]QGR79972.1 hypothetical protein FOC54_08215 [Staphylococcus hominis]
MAEDPKFVVHGSQVQKWTDDIQQLKQERDTYKKQRDELINDMAEVKRKAEAWDKQKDELREMVTFGCHFEEDTPSKYMNVAYRIVLKIMCELDGTNDFKNLSSDLERGSDE